MKPIQTSKPGGMPPFIYALIVCALIATVGVRSGIAADKGPKVTVVFDHALPNVPGKSMKGVLVEYGPGVASVGHTHPRSAFIYATVLEGAIRTSVNDGPAVRIAPDRTFPRCLVIGTLLMRMRARPNPPSCWPCSWSIRVKRNC
jgi:hypothetical protein